MNLRNGGYLAKWKFESSEMREREPTGGPVKEQDQGNPLQEKQGLEKSSI